jgi:phycocyanobilin:ferredoxin oxidoreductase
MSAIWDRLIECQNEIIAVFDTFAEEIAEQGLEDFNQPQNGWINRVWANDSIRRAHIDVVDARDTKGLWMMHVCIFPQLHNNAPIYGFDIIAGKNKITGAFHDFSITTDPDHPMVHGYYDSVDDFVPKKQRELPEWARNIFTERMLAAGNVNTLEEAEAIINIAVNNLRAYVEEIRIFDHTADRDESIRAQNWYCENQQQNPHTPRTMKSLGLDEASVDVFCRDMLFPKII